MNHNLHETSAADFFETRPDYGKNDVDGPRLRPHPIEFFKYCDA